MKTTQKRLQRVLFTLFLVASLALSACGQKGELFLPTEPAPSTPSEDSADN